jgi:hypothetical protein
MDENELDFKAVGLTQFTESLEKLQKYREMMVLTLKSETLASLTKVDVLWKKLWQMSELPDYEDLLRSKEEIRDEMNPPMPQQGGGMIPNGAMPQQGGMPPQAMGGMPNMGGAM